MIHPQSFKDVAEYYSKYRPGYPKKFFDYLVSKFKLAGTGELLDLGCGTGQLAIPLAPYFIEVVGLDPSEDMLAEAKKQAKEKGIHNIIWQQGIAEEISPALGFFKLATIGYAFHWMKAELVLKKLYEIIESNGGVVVVWDDLSPNNSPKAEQWRDKQSEIVKKYLSPDRTKKEIITQTENFEPALKNSHFRTVELYNLDYEKIWSVDSLIGLQYSRPGSSKDVLGDKAGAFEKELTSELLKIEPSGKFVENLRVKALIARK